MQSGEQRALSKRGKAFIVGSLEFRVRGLGFWGSGGTKASGFGAEGLGLFGLGLHGMPSKPYDEAKNLLKGCSKSLGIYSFGDLVIS